MRCGFVSCGPNEVLVVSGCCLRKTAYIAGGRVFVWPIFQEVNRLVGIPAKDPAKQKQIVYYNVIVEQYFYCSFAGNDAPYFGNLIQYSGFPNLKAFCSGDIKVPLALVKALPLNLMTLHVESNMVYTSQGVPISVTGIAQIKIQGQNKEMLSIACEQFLGKDESEIAGIALVTLEGHQRAIMGNMTVEEIYKDRQKFSANVFEVASTDLVNMGITVVSYTLKDVRDDEGYLLSLGMSRTAEVKRDARIGEALAKRDAAIKEAQAEMERMASRYYNDTEIARAKRDYELKKAEYEIAALKKKAEAEMAFQIQSAKTNQKLMEEKVQVDVVERAQEIALEEQEIKRKKQELEGTVKIPAAAEKYRLERLAEANKNKVILEAEGDAQAIKLKAHAEAFAIEAKGKADGSQMQKKAEALSEYREAAIMDMVLEVLPKVAAEVAVPLTQTKKITMVSSGSGDVGPAKIADEILTIISKVPDVVKSLTGVDIVRTIQSSN